MATTKNGANSLGIADPQVMEVGEVHPEWDSSGAERHHASEEVAASASPAPGDDTDTSTDKKRAQAPTPDAIGDNVETREFEVRDSADDAVSEEASFETGDEEQVVFSAHLYVEEAPAHVQSPSHPGVIDPRLREESQLAIENVVMDEESARTAMADRSTPLVEASPSEPKKRRPLCENRSLQLVVVSLFLVTIAAIVAIVLGLQSGHSSPGDHDKVHSVGSNKDSFAKDVLPDYTRAALEDPHSDQSLALDWLWKDPSTTAQLPLFRRIQRYAMAVNFFAGTELRTPDLYGYTKWLKDGHECTWSQHYAEDVVCQEERIRMIAVTNNPTVVGTIPPEVALLSDLVVYDVSETLMKGTVPTEFGLLSDSLELLYLRNARFSGSVPSEIGRLSALLELDIASNMFKYSLPTELGQLKLLQKCEIRNNTITDSIPTEIGLLSNALKSLSLNSNPMTGPIPSELGRLSYLERFTAFDTLVTGTLPTELANLVGLKELHVNKTGLNGTIATEMRSMSSLGYLSLHNTQLTGTFPLCNLIGNGSLAIYSVSCGMVHCDCNCSCGNTKIDSSHP